MFNAVARASIPPEKLLAWAARMAVADRVELYHQPQELWKKSYAADVWGRVADELMRILSAARKPGRELSQRRTDAFVRHAADALTRSNRASEIPNLRALATPSRDVKTKRPRRRSR